MTDQNDTPAEGAIVRNVKSDGYPSGPASSPAVVGERYRVIPRGEWRRWGRLLPSEFVAVSLTDGEHTILDARDLGEYTEIVS